MLPCVHLLLPEKVLPLDDCKCLSGSVSQRNALTESDIGCLALRGDWLGTWMAQAASCALWYSLEPAAHPVCGNGLLCFGQVLLDCFGPPRTLSYWCNASVNMLHCLSLVPLLSCIVHVYLYFLRLQIVHFFVHLTKHTWKDTNGRLIAGDRG